MPSAASPAAIRAQGLVLEPMVAAHADDLFRLLTAPHVHDFLDGAPPSSARDLADWLRRIERRRSPDGAEIWLNWMVRAPGGGMAGHVQATVRPGGTASIAYVMDSAVWGRGYGHAATAAMIEEIRLRHGVTRLQASVDARNDRSIRLLTRLGFLPDPAAATAETGGDLIYFKRLA